MHNVFYVEEQTAAQLTTEARKPTKPMTDSLSFQQHGREVLTLEAAAVAALVIGMSIYKRG